MVGLVVWNIVVGAKVGAVIGFVVGCSGKREMQVYSIHTKLACC